jgi:hypothetical protein
MGEREISKDTLSKIEHQLKAGKDNDPTGLVKEFLDLTHGRLPATKYDDIYQQSASSIKTNDGKLELEITNPFNSKQPLGSSDATASIIKLDKNGQQQERVQLDAQGNVAATYEYRDHHTDVTNYYVDGGKEKVLSTYGYTFYNNGAVDTAYTDVKNGKNPTESHSDRRNMQIF